MILEYAIRAVRGRLVAAAALGTVVVGTRLVQAVALAIFIAGALTREFIVAAGLVAAAMVIVRAVLLRADELLAQETGHRATVAIRRRLLDHLLALGPAYAASRRTGDLAATLVDSAAGLEVAIARGRTSEWLSWIGPLLAALVIGFVDPSSGVLVILALLVAKFAGPIANRIGRRQHDAVFADLSAMDASFVDAVQGMATAKAYGAIGTLRAQLAEQAETVRVASMRALAALFTQMLATRWAIAGAGAIAVVRAAFLANAGEISPAAALTVLLVALVSFVPLDEAGKYSHSTLMAPMAAARLDAFLAEQPRILDVTGGAPSKPAVTFDNVSFRYEATEEDAVTGLDLTLTPGRTVALVGPSGSGKSTVVSLLLRLTEPTSGRITVDGRPLTEIGLDNWWRRVAAVSQDTHLFPGTLRENIALAKPDADDLEIDTAAKAAGLDIAAFPDSYDTDVRERGSRLSGGQRQRVAIARALLSDAPILVLDEATAALDGRTEHEVHAALTELSRDKAVLLVTHRLATVRDADEIVVLERGRVVERGAHDQLLENAGTYRRIVLAGADQ